MHMLVDGALGLCCVNYQIYTYCSLLQTYTSSFMQFMDVSEYKDVIDDIEKNGKYCLQMNGPQYPVFLGSHPSKY